MQKMKIAYMSDLHLEHYRNDQLFSRQQIDFINHTCDILVLAGDIHKNIQGIKWAGENFVIPVIYVLGNHEFYGNFYGDIIDSAIEESFNQENVYFLDNESLLFDSVLFFGSTFWSDFAINGDVNLGKRYVKQGMNDFQLIRSRNSKTGLFTVDQAEEYFEVAKELLHYNIENISEYKKVVISHHGPHMNTNPKQFRGGPICPGFTFDGSEFFGKIDYWIYGHTHFNNDMEINGTRIVTNQAGYPHEPVEGFSPVKVLEV